jgi:cyclopropane-fatty-acyl-phospholipid synthase
MLPSPSVLRDQMARAGLDVLGSREFGQSYSETLRRWHARFDGAWPGIAAQGFDARFRRMWDFYLASCAAAFKGGSCDVTQITLARPG